MKREEGVTLITVAITIIILGLLAALLVKASVKGNILEESNGIKENVLDMIDDTKDKTKNIEQKWDGII